MVSSTTEGSDKPKKYPHIFREADLIVVSKMDLASAVGFDLDTYKADIKMINPKASMIKTDKSKPGSFTDVAKLFDSWRS